TERLLDRIDERCCRPAWGRSFHQLRPEDTQVEFDLPLHLRPGLGPGPLDRVDKPLCQLGHTFVTLGDMLNDEEFFGQVFGSTSEELEIPRVSTREALNLAAEGALPDPPVAGD